MPPKRPWPLPRHQATESLIGLATLATAAFRGQDQTTTLNSLLARAAENPKDASAMLDIATLMHLAGDRDLGLAWQAQALSIRQVYRVGSDQAPSAVRLLAIVVAGDLTENNALEFLVLNSDVQLELLYVGQGLPLPSRLPEHDVVMIAICESSTNQTLLQKLEIAARTWPKPVLNGPAQIERTSRDGTSRLLRSQAGIYIPQTIRVCRNRLERLGSSELSIDAILSDGTYPIIVRPIDTHKGQGQAKLDSPLSVRDYLDERFEADFYLSPYVDYRSSDGQFRKYRVVLIDGAPYLCHLAISSHWMVHYMNAGMTECPHKRAEEALVMQQFDKLFVARHRQALEGIARLLELDYVGLDCGETSSGDLLLFEVDSGMTVHAMDPQDMFPYKQIQMAKVFRAFRDMVRSRAALRPAAGIEPSARAA